MDLRWTLLVQVIVFCSALDENNSSLQVAGPGPGPSLNVPTNRLLYLNASCSTHLLTITVTMERPFKGIIYAKDFAQECRTEGVLQEVLTLDLPTSGCGVRLFSQLKSTNLTAGDDLQYMVSLVVQMDRHLRQITDQERVISCPLAADQTKLNSLSMRKVIIETITTDVRTGRMKSDRSLEEAEQEEAEELQSLDKARAWMELSAGLQEDRDLNLPDKWFVNVGDIMSLTVKTTLPVNIGWRVVDCTAHDGIGDTSQKLLDDTGCPIDEQILPELNFSSPRMTRPTTQRWDATNKVLRQRGGVMRYQEATAHFPAFKFPDRDRLHLSCGLQLCKGDCQKMDCLMMRRASRHLGHINRADHAMKQVDFVDGQEVIDRLEVYNSVQVIAPEIEFEDYRGNKRSFDVGASSGRPKLVRLTSGERTFCVSTNKMAMAFCALGVIFIVAILVAIISLLRSRRKDSRSYYSRSVFSSSTSTGGSAYGGSKLLLHESPCLGSGRGNWPYARPC